MNKRLLSLLLCFCLILPTFAACNNEQSAETPTTTAETVVTTTTTETTTEITTTVTADGTTASNQATTTEQPTATKKPTTTTANKTTTKANQTVTTTTTKTAQPTVNGLPLVVGGQSSYKIVRADKSTKSERNAAYELQEYLETITGCKLPIVTDKEAPAEYEIIVGKTNREKADEFNRTELETDGFIIKTIRNKLYLVGGGDRGTLYAVYEFLEAYLGCRFYTAGVEKVPTTATIALSPIKEDKQIPLFDYRCVHWTEYCANQDISVKRKLSGSEISESWGGCIDYADREMVVHTLGKLVPSNTYFASHPEYYRLTSGGERDKDNLCLSHPDVLAIVIERVKEYLRDNPNADLISVSQMDVMNGECYCKDCRALDTAEGAYSASMITFVNKVARAVKGEFPHVKIHTLAYLYTRTVPKTVRPDDNVAVQLCDIECCFSHSLDSGCSHDNNGFCADLKNWSAICDNLYIWNYNTSFSHYNMTYPNFSCLRENIRLFADNNVKGVYEEGNAQSISGEFGELRCYLQSKCLWDPYMTEAEYYAHMDDFLKGVYGDGWQHIREYIDFAETIGDAVHFGFAPDVEDLYPTIVNIRGERELPADLTLDHILNYQSTDWEPYINWYTDVKAHPIVPKGQECFAKAIALAKTANQKERLERASIQTDYIQSYYYYHLYRKYLRGDMVKLITHYLTTNTPLTDAEITSLSNQVADYVDTLYADKYFAYNSKLWDRIFSYKIAINNMHYHEQLNPNLNKTPARWY